MTTIGNHQWRAYCDGACSTQKGAGGWAYILENPNGGKTEDYGPSLGPTTNNRMELCAIKGALISTPDNIDLVIFTDSAYAKGALTNWWRGWEKNGWVTQKGDRVENRQLITDILHLLCKKLKVDICHVPRNSTPEMARADELAKRGKDCYELEPV